MRRCGISSKGGSVCPPFDKKSARSLAELVTWFIKWRDKNPDSSIQHVKNQPTLEKAIEEAVFARKLDRKRHDHQRRIKRISMRQKCQDLLRRVRDFKAAKSFAIVFDLVNENHVPGFAEMSVYDTAHRIGAYLALEPERVYLHCGTRDGARALRLDVSAGVLEMNQLPKELRRLKPHLVEDFLCVCMDQLARFSR